MLDSEVWTWEFRDPGSTPDVSIVICAHGQVDVTMRCLASLNRAQHLNACRAEVILVDDASPDDTLHRVGEVRGLRVVELPENLGFLRAANAGMYASNGRDVLFLNNDTEVVGRWLDPLVNLMSRHPNALVVGSRLVYPNGVLQEAGGIVFADGSGWNYGRGESPWDPRFGFERQVDYVSGASLLVRGELIRARGGFDEEFAPAYYEDVDLCFEARRQGGEVWYEPRSVVIHHEGLSNGTDENSGMKAFQAVNKAKFVSKWEAELRLQGSPKADSVASARQRTPRGRILVIDHEVPTPDRDAGSARMVAILKSMMELGFAVLMLPLNGWRREPYTSDLEFCGVEVLGPSEVWWEHIVACEASITHVWICRPHVAEGFLERVRADLPRATVIYDTVDLHFLRLDRKAQITGSPEDKVASLEQQLQEVSIFDSVDKVVVVSEEEREVVSSLTSSAICVVPTSHPAGPVSVPAPDRSDLLFVGGFRHAPNEDAVCWFVTDVLPKIHARRPDLRLTIIGSDPTPRVLELAGEKVAVLGWVSELTPHYASHRLSIAPIRFGAGVKGKVGESLSYGLPMVVTSMASEGMHIQDGVHALVADDAESFASRVLDLVESDDLWTRLSNAGQELMQGLFGSGATRDRVSTVLELGGMKESSWVSP